MVEVLNIQRITPAEKAGIEAVDANVHLIDAGGWFDGEIRASWVSRAKITGFLSRSTTTRCMPSGTSCSTVERRWHISRSRL